MSNQTLLESKHDLLTKTLHQSLHEKDRIETNIRQQMEDLKKLQILLEKRRVQPKPANLRKPS